jgi:hypothetical protein
MDVSAAIAILSTSNAISVGFVSSVLCFRIAHVAQKYGQLCASLVPDRERLALAFTKTRSINYEISLAFGDILNGFSSVATA